MAIATKTQKGVRFIGRAEFKASGKVLYRVQAEGSANIHDVTVSGGKVTSCVTNGETCQGFYYRRQCCHSAFVAALEARRVNRESTEMALFAADKAQAEKPAVARAERGSMHRDVKMISGVPMR